MSTFSGSLMSAACATRIPMIARPFSLGDSTVRRSRLRPSRRGERGGRRRHRGGRRRTSARSCPASGSRAARAHDHVTRRASPLPARRSQRIRRARHEAWPTLKPASFSATAAATFSERAISRRPFPAPVLERRAGGNDLVRRHEGRPVRPDERQQPLGPGRLANGHVDVVDRPLASSVLLALDLDLGGDGAGGVRDVQVVVEGRPRPGRRAPQPRLQRSRGAPRRWRSHPRRARSACRRRPARPRR